MADIKKIKYEPGNKRDTSDAQPKCPNGHAVSVRANRARGAGRVYCTVCGWSDAETAFGATPLQAPVNRENRGVTILSQHGMEGEPSVRVFRK